VSCDRRTDRQTDRLTHVLSDDDHVVAFVEGQVVVGISAVSDDRRFIFVQRSHHLLTCSVHYIVTQLATGRQ